MELSFDIVDYIFSFLISHPESLIACSKVHPVFSQMVEKHQYHEIFVHTGGTRHPRSLTLELSHLTKLLSQTPRIASYIRVLRVDFSTGWVQFFEEIARILPKFQLLSSIWFRHRGHSYSWQGELPQAFRTALENCLHLPTLRQVHVLPLCFPLSMLDNHANITHLSVYGNQLDMPIYTGTTYPQFKYLWVHMMDDKSRKHLSLWAKHHILQLESLVCGDSGDQTDLELLKACSDTLNNLDLRLMRQASMPRSIEVLKTASSSQCLTIDICVHLFGATLDDVDFSPLAALAESSASFQRIDLYISSQENLFTHTRIDTLLAVCGLTKLIERGVLVVYPEESAPTFFDVY